MPTSRRDLLMSFLQKGMDQGSSAAREALGDQRKQSLEEYLQGAKKSADVEEEQRAMAGVQALQKNNPKSAVTFKGVSVNPEPAINLKALLTPAQESAEKAVGKQIADFDAAGGRPAMEKNLNSLREVQGDLKNRDMWDRGVGVLSGVAPSVMGLIGSTEKARRDKARNTALTIARTTDPNPTEKQIEAIMGQIYDPSSSNEDNKARIDRFLAEQEAKNAQMEQASQRYKQTGYATMGQAPAAAPQGGLDAAKAQRLQELRAKRAAGKLGQ